MDTTIHDLARMAAAMVRGYGLPNQGHAGDHEQVAIPDAEQRSRARRSPQCHGSARRGRLHRPAGAGLVQGQPQRHHRHTPVCIERGRRCMLILANDIRAEKAFPTLVRAALGETGVPYRWEYGLAR